MSDTIEGMERIYNEALDLARRKNHDYGDAWRSNGWRGNLSRVFEKSHRLRTLLWNGNAPEARVTDEDVRQTAIDMLNTLTFFIMNMEAGVEWGHEMPFHHIKVAHEPEWQLGLGNIEPSGDIIERVHQGLVGSAPTESLPAITFRGEPVPDNLNATHLPVREPGRDLQDSIDEVSRAAGELNQLAQKEKPPSPSPRQSARP